MLKVVDGVVTVQLTGHHQDPLFWWSLSLLLLGVSVAVVCFTLPVAYAIGALFVFAVAVFGFNIQKHKAKQRHIFTQGWLKLTPKRFEFADKALSLSDDATFVINGLDLSVFDRGIEYCFVGFESLQEMQVAQAVLQGKHIKKQEVSITMTS